MSRAANRTCRDRIRTGAALLASVACATSAVAAFAGSAPARLDPAAKRPDGPEPSEYWDMVGRLDTGHYLFSRFMFTHLGPGDRNAVAIGHLVFPDGRVHRWKNLKPGMDGQLSSDGLRIDVLNSHFDLAATPSRLDVDKRNTQIHMEFTLAGHEPTPTAFSRGDYGFALLDAAAPIRGTFFHPKKAPETLRASGRVAVTHTWVGAAEPSLASWRIDFVTLDADSPIHLIEIARADGSRSGWLTAGPRGAGRLSTTDVAVDLSGRHTGVMRPGYRVPERLALSGEGVSGSVQLGRVLLEQDPLEDLKELNWMIRTLVQPMGQPHRVWIESPYEIEITRDGAPAQTSAGSGVVVITFFDGTPGS